MSEKSDFFLDLFSDTTELQDLDKTLLALLDFLPTAITIVSKTGEIVYANKRAEKVHGLVKSKLCTKKYDDPTWSIIDIDGKPFPKEGLPFNIVMKTKKPVHGVRHAISWPDGRRVLLSINGAPLMNKTEIIGAVFTLEDVTQELELEMALKRSKIQYNRIFKKMISGFALHEIILDDEGKPVDYRFLDINPAFEKQTGLNRRDILGKTVLEVLPHTEQYWIENYGKVALTGKPIEFENYANSLKKYFQVRAFSPKKYQFAVMTHDITQRVVAEKRQKELTRLYSFISQINQMVVRETSVERVLQESCKIAVERGEFSAAWICFEDPNSGSLVPQASYSLDRKELLEIHKTLAQKGEEFCTAFTAYKTGQPKIINNFSLETLGIRDSCVVSFPISIYGKPVGVFNLVSSDISTFTEEELELVREVCGDISFALEALEEEKKRKLAESKLLETTQKLEAVINASPLAIMVLEPDGTISQWNKASEKIYGFTEEEVLGKKPPVFPPDKIEEGRELLGKALSGQSFSDLEVKRIRKDGSSLILSLSMAPIYDTSGKISGVIGMGMDITKRKEDENRLRHSLAEKEILLKEIHHRVKNNLQIISSLLSLQSQYVEGEEQQTVFTSSQQRIAAMAVIHEILYEQQDFIALSLTDYLQHLTDSLILSIQNNNNRIRILLDLQEISIKPDLAVTIGLLINELVTNSIKQIINSSGSGTIVISFKIMNDKNILTVKDTGPGFPDLFDPRKTKTLGLNLVLALVEQIGGTLAVENRQGGWVEIVWENQT